MNITYELIFLLLFEVIKVKLLQFVQQLDRLCCTFQLHTKPTMDNLLSCSSGEVLVSPFQVLIAKFGKSQI